MLKNRSISLIREELFNDIMLKAMIWCPKLFEIILILEGGGPQAQVPACSQQAPENPLGDPIKEVYP
uniref:Uncharacterized protein n=1 Tax=Romanomermis culicivorax TaxID=13658 RepID=A0A915KCG6_ROMCU